VGRVIIKAKTATLRGGAWTIKRALLVAGQGLTNLAESSFFSICDAQEGNGSVNGNGSEDTNGNGSDDTNGNGSVNGNGSEDTNGNRG
jgi:hypothetical protein